MQLPIVALRDVTVLPKMLMHVDVSRENSRIAMERAMHMEQDVFLTCQKNEMLDEPQEDDLFRIGTIARVKQIMKLPEQASRVLVEGKQRARLIQVTSYHPFLEGEVEWLPCLADVVDIHEEAAMMRTLRGNLEAYARRNPTFQEGGYRTLLSIQTLEELLDQTLIRLPMNRDQRQALLEQPSVSARFYMLNGYLESEIQILDLKRKIQGKVREHMDQHQKDYVLREQLKVIREELGEDEADELDQLETQLAGLDAGVEVKERLEKELRRLRMMPFASQEATVIRTYIETLLELPWQKTSQDSGDILQAEHILNEDHYGMERIKERILEFLAVRQLTGKGGGSILCLVGPPGTGKTSIAQSVARALDKKYVRVCLGGVHDEAEIRGHRRTYIGAMPGRIINGLRQVGVSNPLMLLDEIDKVSSDYKGDVSSALLEVLDSEQNTRFRDHYVELPVDLSQVLFIATANTLDTIPGPLLDRMEILEVSSYTENEKYHIARQYLVKKACRKNGIGEGQLSISDPALRRVIVSYTREAGVRSLERRLEDICRKAARELLQKKRRVIRVTESNLGRYLGKERYLFQEGGEEDQVGLARGLAWTSVGGDTLLIEVNTMPGEGRLQLTGKLGEVMKESAQTGISYLRSVGCQYQIDNDYFEKHDIHLHIPEGAVPKDGPSAGITMAAAVLSAITGRKLRADLAMTGEITLRGRVLPVGGLKEKLLAAKRIGIREVLVPERNRPDIAELSEEIVRGMDIVYVERMEDVLQRCLLPAEEVTGGEHDH